MIHLHVRDEQQRHSIFPEHYEPVLKALKESVSDQMLIQVTSESAGRFDRHQQMQAMKSLQPDAFSIALKELIPDKTACDDAARFLQDMECSGSLVQYILYSAQELKEYYSLIASGVIPSQRNFLLFVLGKYPVKTRNSFSFEPSLGNVTDELGAFLDAKICDSMWMCCSFGKTEQDIMPKVIKLGGHARVGFENNLYLKSGEIALDNAELVKGVVAEVKKAGHESLVENVASILKSKHNI